MEILILTVSLLILAETSLLTWRKFRPSLSNNRRKIYVDTSALIDGRILNIARTGFLDGDLIILKSVLLELQLLADAKDSDKRNHGRIGLDNVAELERVINVNTEIIEDTSGLKKVDEALLKLAKENKGYIITMDFNLIKVATADQIPTLNINDLALAVRTELMPGERFKVKIRDKGSNPGQGIGHLPNGAMVVVDNAASKIGQELDVKLVKYLETSSGRMIFAKITKSK